jgi:hypothetical protein
VDLVFDVALRILSRISIRTYSSRSSLFSLKTGWISRG